MLKKADDVLGYVNVYRDADGDIELGSTDLYETVDDQLADLLGEDVDGLVTFVGRAEVRLIRSVE